MTGYGGSIVPGPQWRLGVWPWRHHMGLRIGSRGLSPALENEAPVEAARTRSGIGGRLRTSRYALALARTCSLLPIFFASRSYFLDVRRRGPIVGDTVR